MSEYTKFNETSNKILLGFICIYLSFSPAYSQVGNIDSLVSLADELPDDSVKINHLIGLANILYYSDPNQSRLYLDQASIIAKKVGIENGTIYKSKGNLDLIQGNYKPAIDNYLQALEIYRKNDDSLNIANIYNNLGILYQYQENFEESKRYYATALKFYTKVNDFNGQASIFLNLGWLYDHMDYPDSAILNYNKSRAINSDLKDPTLDASIFLNLGTAYMHKGSYDTAVFNFEKGLTGFISVNDNDGKTEGYSALGELNLLIGKYVKSLEYLNKSEELATIHILKERLVEIYRLKSEVFEKLGDPDNALEYHQKYKVLSDSIFTAEKDEALFALQMNQQHEADLAALNQQNILQKERLKAGKFKNFLLLAITIFSLIVLLISAYYFMNKYKTSLQLEIQNKEIRVQKLEIEKQKKKLSRANKDLKSKNLSLIHLNKEKNFLLHVVAHDLKSPLNQMTGLSQVIQLEEENLSPVQLSCLERIDTVSGRLSNMIDKILDIDAIESRSNNLLIEDTDLRELLEETVEDLDVIAKSKGIRIHTDHDSFDSTVKIDKQHAQQVFENLISNAIKFSPHDKDVYIKIKEDKEDIVTEVKDHGPGLTEDDKTKVFQKFQKLSAKPTGDEDSNGLGLSIVKMYVEAMNGKVWVESNYGSGASFKVAFKKA